MTRRSVLFAIFSLTGLFIAGGFAAIGQAETGDKLKISTWPGGYMLSQQKAFFAPYSEETGTEIDVATSTNPLSSLKSWKEDSKADRDVVTLTSHQAEIACREGLLASFAIEDIAGSDKIKDISRDFLANSLMDCAVPTVAWSTLMVVKPAAFKKKKPRTWTDFFNVKKFPGKRSMPKTARYSLEIALMSTGVKPGDVYEKLASINGQKRAFRALDKLKENILWWEKSAQSIEQLGQEDVVMGVAYNGRLFHSIIKDSLDVTLIWQGQIYDYDYWGVPVSSGNRSQAMAFVKFATKPEQLAKQSRWMPYGPMRRSAFEYVGNHDLIDVHMSAYLPTTKAHFQRALKFNEGWWLSDAGQALEGRFNSWLDGELEWPKEAQ